jgi:hypothetical protein
MARRRALTTESLAARSNRYALTPLGTKLPITAASVLPVAAIFVLTYSSSSRGATAFWGPTTGFCSSSSQLLLARTSLDFLAHKEGIGD